MLVIDARNVNDAWHQAKIFLNAGGVRRPSRVGEVLEYPDPVATKYQRPTERVLFDPNRNCNPFFHFMEGLWMLAGRNDIRWIAFFNQQMMSYSDDGILQHGAYGYRWRRHFSIQETAMGTDGKLTAVGEARPFDQLQIIVGLLKRNHSERRAVLQMWDPTTDLGFDGVDVPCNTSVYFKVRDGKLAMTVSNRSNDIVWGCYGANCVHMSMLQEYVAALVGVEVGPYHQVSDSWHAYTQYWEAYGGTDTTYSPVDHYQEGNVKPFPLVAIPESFDADLQAWIENPTDPGSYGNPVFQAVAIPMFLSYRAYKDKKYHMALAFAEGIEAADWRWACIQWLQSRIAAKAERKAA